MAKILYDPRCEDLARVFLEDNGGADEERVTELAGIIQVAIEDFLADQPEPPGPRLVGKHRHHRVKAFPPIIQPKISYST